MADAQPDHVTPPITDRECTMQKQSLTALVRQHLGTALTAASGRSAHTVYGGHEHLLRQTLIALRVSTSLDEHENAGEATIQVLHGRVTLVAGENHWTAHPAT
jgi:quercetin dioxygenase-like cupin family protein